MELATQERKRQDDVLFHFSVKPLNSGITTKYAFVKQLYIHEDPQKRIDSVGGIGPFSLVKNKMPYAAFKGNRSLDGKEERGVIVMSGGFSKNLVIRNWADKTELRGTLNQKLQLTDLKIDQAPTAYDFSVVLSQDVKTQLQCVMGCSKGNIYVFDPHLMGEGKIYKYYQTKLPVAKRKRVDLVKWLEPTNLVASQFVVVYEDGTFNLFKTDVYPVDKDHLVNAKDNVELEAIKVLQLMQEAVQKYDFDQHYTDTDKLQTHHELIAQENELIKGIVQTSSRIYKNRACNITFAQCTQDNTTNPQIIWRFDVRQINDVSCMSRNGEPWIVSACNDGYVKILQIAQTPSLVKVLKGLSGNPLCIDIQGVGHLQSLNSKRDLIAVGYEDDSLIVYSIDRNFEPLYRGVGHRSFVCQVKFDNYYIDKCAETEQSPNDVCFSEKRAKSDTILNQIQGRSSIRQAMTIEKEYRLVSGGEDGTINWWGFYSSSFTPSAVKTKSLIGHVTKVQQIKPIHSIHLAESAQFYAIVMGPETICFAQSDMILSFYTVEYSKQKPQSPRPKQKNLEDEEVKIEVKTPPSKHRVNQPQWSDDETPEEI